jgi:hypothetical protein
VAAGQDLAAVAAEELDDAAVGRSSWAGRHHGRDLLERDGRCAGRGDRPGLRHGYRRGQSSLECDLEQQRPEEDLSCAAPELCSPLPSFIFGTRPVPFYFVSWESLCLDARRGSGSSGTMMPAFHTWHLNLLEKTVRAPFSNK